MELMQEIVLDAPNAVIRGEAFGSIADLLIFFGRRNNLVKNPVLAPMVYQVKILSIQILALKEFCQSGSKFIVKTYLSGFFYKKTILIKNIRG